MQHLEVSCAVRPIEWPLGVKWLICVSLCDEANNKLVKLAGEYSILYDWRDSSYSRKGQNWLVWEKIGNGLEKIR